LYVWRAEISGDKKALSIKDSSSNNVPGTILEIFYGKGILVATGSGVLLLARIQLEGSTEMRADDFSKEYGLKEGEILG
jgi:methionyl-tRNA formyltransferase